MVFHNAVDGRQSEAVSLAEPLGGEKRLEDMVQDGFFHAYAGIGHCEDYVGARGEKGGDAEVGGIEMLEFGRYLEGSSFGHSVPGIDAQVHEHLNQLAAVADHPEIGLELRFDEDRPIKGPANQRNRFFDDGRHILRTFIVTALPGKSQELFGHVGRLLERCLGLIEADGELVQIHDAVLRHHFDVIDIQHHGGEEVVEIVGDAAGEPTQRFHLAKLQKMKLDIVLLGKQEDGFDADADFVSRFERRSPDRRNPVDPCTVLASQILDVVSPGGGPADNGVFSRHGGVGNAERYVQISSDGLLGI